MAIESQLGNLPSSEVADNTSVFIRTQSGLLTNHILTLSESFSWMILTFYAHSLHPLSIHLSMVQYSTYSQICR